MRLRPRDGIRLTTAAVVLSAMIAPAMADAPSVQRLGYYKFKESGTDHIGTVRSAIGINPTSLSSVTFTTCANKTMVVDGTRLIKANGDCNGKPFEGESKIVVFGQIIDVKVTGVTIEYGTETGGGASVALPNGAFPSAAALKPGDKYIFFPTANQTKDEFVADFTALTNVVGMIPKDKGIGVIALEAKKVRD